MKSGVANNALDGIGHYTKALAREFQSGTDITLLPFSFGLPESQACETISVGPFQRQALRTLLSRAPFKGLAALEDQEVSLIHATDHFVPKSAVCPVIATLMDVIPLSHPQWVDYRFKWLHNAAWRKSFSWADRIVTISEYSKSQIVEHLGVPETDVDVVPLGVDDEWFEDRDQSLLAAAKQRYQVPAGYLLCVGTLQPRKNVSRLISAHQQLPSSLRYEYPLVIIGRYGWGAEELLVTLRGGADTQIRWLDYVPRGDLQLLMAGATGFVFPSLLEGFGLPVLEAFASGVPVAASSTTSMPEVAGDAALLFDPESAEAIADAMRQLLEDEAVREALKSRGIARARQFSWRRTALGTLAAYQKLL